MVPASFQTLDNHENMSYRQSSASSPSIPPDPLQMGQQKLRSNPVSKTKNMGQHGWFVITN